MNTKRGQLAMEFSFILLILIVFLNLVILPLYKEAKGMLEDIQYSKEVSNIRHALQNNIYLFSYLPNNSKQFLGRVYPKMAIECQNNTITFKLKLNSPSTICAPPYENSNDGSNMLCTFSYTLPSTIECNVPFGSKGELFIKKDNGIKLIVES